MSHKPSRLLTTRKVVFLVIAAAAPLAAMAGNVPLALARGGVTLPAAFVLAAAVLLCFSVAYAAMSRRVVNSGAFYTYVARGLGKPAGVAAGYVSLAGYAALAFGLAAAFGYFTALVFDELGVSCPWWVLSAFSTAVVAFLGYRSADLSAKVLGVLMSLEFVVLFVFDLLVVGKSGADAFPSVAFDPSEMFHGGLAIAAMFAFTSFVGFESAALYGEESRDPGRTIPRSMFIAVSSVAVFYIFTSWIIIGAAGGADAQAMAERDLGDLVFNLMNSFGGEVLYDLAAVLLCTSILASQVALHNAASRYLFALSRERVLPARFGDYHPQYLSPHVASVAVSLATAVVVAGMGALGADPYTVIAASLVGLGTLAIVLTQAVTALATLSFFGRRDDGSIWQTKVAPVVAAVGLGAAFVAAAANYGTLTGATAKAVNLVPLLLIVLAAAGVAVAIRIRRTNPRAYSTLAESQLRRQETERLPRPADLTYQRRYCIVGGGPSGMVMARALLAEGVPFDWYERNGDFGGIWDIDAPGSPMYASAHFISSRYTSGFFGYPMPDDLPDYPSWRQIRDYLRDFARKFDLYRHVTFDTEVSGTRLLPGDRWAVELSDGRTLEYDGLICCPGVTWHPNRAAIPGAEQFTGTLRHSVDFRDGMELRGKRVLIVGGGNSGVDIACDAARFADQAYLSLRRGYRFLPKHLGGIPTDAVVNGYVEVPKGVVLSTDLNKSIDNIVGDLTRFGLQKPDHDALASHPIMNTQVLHYLAHGDLVAKPDVDHLTPTGAVFTDGSSVEVDEVLLATGYDYQVPFVDRDLFEWKSGHPQLYLNVFSRQVDSLYVIGFIEFADAAYKRFDEMAQLVVMDIRARETGVHRDEILALKHSDVPDLRGGMKYIDSPRHANYVESHTYQAYLAELRDRFGWPDPGEHTYDELLPPHESAAAASAVTGATS
ncbi:MAG: amino acid permease [Nocardioidaceae bacterium]